MSSAEPMRLAQPDARPKNAPHTAQPAGKSDDVADGETQREFADRRPQAMAQRRLQDSADSSAQSLQLKAFWKMAQSDASAKQLESLGAAMSAPAAQRLEDEGAPTSGIAQLKGPRNYAATFKPQKDEMMKWLKDSELIGMDLTPEGEASDEENAKIGWHHQYPYSHLWENHGRHALADHGANLKLGPMKNRLGDPGHEIDISYGKAKANEGAVSGADISPTYSPLSARLLAERYARPQLGVKENGPTDDIDIHKVGHDDLRDEVYDKAVDKEGYWSEWYLSAAIRAKLLGDAQLGAAIDQTRVPAIIGAKATIISATNKKLDGLRYTYATHTPALENGTLGPFQKKPLIETGIPSSKLSRIGVLGEKLVAGKSQTYADLLHGILLGQKWITRGSQGESHSLVEQFRDKMKIGNLALIQKCLTDDALAHLKLAVEAEYKQDVFDSLPALDGIANAREAFCAALKLEQLALGAGNLPQATVERVVEATIHAFRQTKTKKLVVAPTVSATSFVPTYPPKGAEKKILKETFEHFLSNDDYEEGLEEVAFNLMDANALTRWREKDEDKNWMYGWTGNVLLTAGDLSAGIQALIKESIPTKTVGSGRVKKQEPNMAKVDEFSQKIIDRLTAKSGDNEEHWQEPGSQKITELIDWDKETVAEHFLGRHKSNGKNLVLHLAAIASKPAHIKYAAGIERALRIPGKGYGDSALKYPPPEEIANAEADAHWDFNAEKEGLFRQAWYEAEFGAYLARFIAQADIQQSLTGIVPV